MNPHLATAAEEFSTIFGETPEFFGSAPGRIEILGNHTDYNDGFALAAAIDRSIIVVGRPIPGNTCKAYSLTFKSGSSFSADDPIKSDKDAWLNYMMAVVWQLNKEGYQSGGFEALIMGDVPLGAGLSSSAAMEMATGNFIQAMLGFSMPVLDMAVNCRAAENGFVGVQSGILDQWTSGMGQAGKTLLLDCRELRILDTPAFPDHIRLVVADTNSPHVLAEGDYNRRQESSFRAAAICAQQLPEKNITHLRDVSYEELESCRSAMSDEDYRRARHVVTENARALAGAEALQSGDAVRLGALFNESHESSKRDFENSSSALDAMVEAATGLPGCYGSRLTGGGFGGATINLVEADAVDTFSDAIKRRYRLATGMEAACYAFTPSDGAFGGAV